MAQTDPVREQLEQMLSDVYSVEQQSLAQMETAPEIAGEISLASYFRQHLPETEGHAEAVGRRLEALGGSPSRIKDAVMALGGKGMLLFARSQPDAPGKLVAHAHSYEAMEWAAYDVLGRMAERADDPETVAVARQIRDNERAMMERLERGFDAAAGTSLQEIGEEDLESHLRSYLADAHALEVQAIQMLEKAPEIGGDEALARIYREHLAESRDHARRVEARLDALGGDTSKLKDLALRAAGMNWALFFQAQGDTPVKLAVFAYAFENLEIAGYELLRRVAERAGDAATIELATTVLPQERAMADRLAGAFDRALEATLATQGLAAG